MVSHRRQIIERLAATSKIKNYNFFPFPPYFDGFSSLANRLDLENVHKFFDWDKLSGELHIYKQVDTVWDIFFIVFIFIIIKRSFINRRIITIIRF